MTTVAGQDYSEFHDPRAARELYVQFRAQSIEKLLKEYESRIDKIRTSLQEAARRSAEAAKKSLVRGVIEAVITPQKVPDVRALQKELNRAYVQRRVLLRARTSGKEAISPSEEFDRIVALPYVVAYGVDDKGEKLQFVIASRIEHNITKVVYDKGEWLLSVGENAIYAEVLRNTLKENFSATTAPSHLTSSKDFCFGGNKPVLETDVGLRQYYQAIVLAMHCITTVEPNSHCRLVTAFPKEQEAAA